MHQKNPYAHKKPDFARLASRYPDFAPLQAFISESGYASIDFHNPAALRALTKCLLKEEWNLNVDLREDRICPTVCGSLDYIYHLLDIEPYLPSSSRPLRILDIGTGAIAIYPILLHRIRPEAEITATEIDDISYEHALKTLKTNDISSPFIKIQKALSLNPVLFPLLQDVDGEQDIVMCNPPFFGSVQEMEQGMELKERIPHAAPTAAKNELITRGGEVAFITSMIQESITIGERCRWYTSLVGKYSSLGPLVDLLRGSQIDNYFIKPIKQARTSRWIIGWSHGPWRLPDSVSRPEQIFSNTSFARLLPPSNTYILTPLPRLPISDLKGKIVDILKTIDMNPSNGSSDPAEYDQSNPNIITVAPSVISWSRAARRQAARSEKSKQQEDKVGPPNEPHKPLPILRARLSFVSTMLGKQYTDRAPEEDAHLQVDWLEGRRESRELLENFCKFILSKADMSRKRPADGSYDQSDKEHKRT
nr:hypothetical protein L204_01289 [Cryptococcus depauperatus CBS 7855]